MQENSTNWVPIGTYFWNPRTVPICNIILILLTKNLKYPSFPEI